MDHQSIYQLFQEVATVNGAKLAFQHKKGGNWFDVSWTEARESVTRVSKALIAMGVAKGDRVCILSGTRLEWCLCDYGIVGCGAVTVGIYPSLLPADCAYIINHCDAEIVFVEESSQLDKILEVRADLPNLRQIVIFEGDSDTAAGVLGWEDFLDKGADVSDEQARERGEEVGADDLASIVYTSGTTGVPKGAMITNANLLFTSQSVIDSLELAPHYKTLMFLPLAHVFARLIAYTCLRYPAPMAFAEDFTTVPQNLREIQPHFMASVPRLYEKAQDKIFAGVEEAGGVKKALFNWAVGVGRRVSAKKLANEPVTGLLAIQHNLARKLVLHKISDAMGGRLEWAISGAAPLNKAIGEFFHACDVNILEGIGMTENTSFSHVNRYDNNRFGTVGQPGPGIEARIAEDGEVLIRGGNVMKGYFKNDEATAETIDEDGWLYTGDIGEIDADGFLRITDRKKDLIVTAGGKNVAPQRIEQIMRTCPLIAQVVAIGDKRKFISALITLDPDAIQSWAVEKGLGDKGVEELAADPKVREVIEAEVMERNKQLASYESIKTFHIVPRDFTIEGGELTPTMKVKRKVVTARYQAEIDALYPE
jgi:long-chain acyl-CoA synthetase